MQKKRSQIYRLFVLGGKSLPEIRKKSEGTASERYWARVVNIFTDRNGLTKELFSDKLRKGDTARPVGEGKYAIVKHQNHAELAYILEMPKEPGEAQKELGVEISDEDETQQSADIFTKLKVQRYQVPIKPLIEGKLE